MRLNSALYYAIVGIAQISAHDSQRPLSCPGLCKEFGLSNKFMSLILKRMTQAGLIMSTRGTKGGYKLAKPSDEISLLEILEAIDGTLAAGHVTVAGFDSESAAIVERTLAEVVADARNRLDSVTLASLLAATTLARPSITTRPPALAFGPDVALGHA